MQQKMLFLFGEFDNQLRKQKCMAGIKEMLLAGDWPTMQPLGFDNINTNGKRRIVVNQKGKLLQQAFQWKATEGLSNQAIRARLAEKGLKLNHLEEEINPNVYSKYAEKYRSEKKEIEANLSKASQKVSNLEECVDMAIGFATKLPFKLLSADYFTKQQIQFLIFPEGISYNKQTDRCRTKRVNTVFAYIAYLKQVFGPKKAAFQN